MPVLRHGLTIITNLSRAGFICLSLQFALTSGDCQNFGAWQIALYVCVSCYVMQSIVFVSDTIVSINRQFKLSKRLDDE